MPTNYTGNPTAAQAPSSKPGPGVAPIFALPNDGEPVNVASIYQDLKTAADYAAWLTAPTPDSTASTSPAWFTKNVRGLKRAGYDHRGFPGGRVMVIDEEWLGLTAVTTPGTGASSLPKWKYRLIGTGSAMGPVEPLHAGTASSDFSRTMGVGPAVGAAGNLAELMGNGTLFNGNDDTEAVIEFDVLTQVGADGRMVMGFADAAGDMTIGLLAGAYFGVEPGHANYQAITGDGAALGMTDTGVGVNGFLQRLRIELCGKNVADGGGTTGEAVFFIDGAEVARRTANLPFAANCPLSPRFATLCTTNLSSLNLNVGYLQIRAMLKTGDAF